MRNDVCVARLSTRGFQCIECFASWLAIILVSAHDDSGGPCQMGKSGVSGAFLKNAAL